MHPTSHCSVVVGHVSDQGIVAAALRGMQTATPWLPSNAYVFVLKSNFLPIATGRLKTVQLSDRDR
jgi:hypothetical protein